MKKIMRIIVCLMIVLLLSSFAHAQKINLIGTTWTVFTRIEKNENWNKYMIVTFLKGGKLKINDNTCDNGTWKLNGKKVSFEVFCSGNNEFELTIKGNTANGGGLIGMGQRGEVWVRMVKK